MARSIVEMEFLKPQKIMNLLGININFETIDNNVASNA